MYTQFSIIDKNVYRIFSVIDKQIVENYLLPITIFFSIEYKLLSIKKILN